MNVVQLLAGPIVGGTIGYFTNYLAIKMLFRPLKEVRIGNFKVPFTPGIIPRGQGRLAAAIGMAVSKDLLSFDVLKEKLLCDDVKERVYDGFADVLKSTKEKDVLIEEISPLVGEAVAKEVIAGITEAVEGSFFSAMLNANTLASFTDPIANRINKASLGSLVGKLDSSHEELKEMIIEKYENLIENKLPDMLKAVDFQSIIEDRVNQMDVLEVENMILGIMKKELNAIVNLGALLGLLIGIVMIFI